MDDEHRLHCGRNRMRPVGADDSVRPIVIPEFAGWSSLRRPLLFRLAGKEGGEKGRWDAFGACCGYYSGGYLFFSRYNHTYSPYGRYSTRRLLRYTKFVGSCL